MKTISRKCWRRYEGVDGRFLLAIFHLAIFVQNNSHRICDKKSHYGRMLLRQADTVVVPATLPALGKKYMLHKTTKI